MPEDKAISPDNYVRKPGGYEERGYRPMSGTLRPSGRPPQTPAAVPPSHAEPAGRSGGNAKA